MLRKEFLALLGTGAGAALLGCLGGCKTDDPTPPTAPTVDFTIDLADPAFGNLTQAGGYVLVQGVIVAYTLTGTYVAAQQACPHIGSTLTYAGSAARFVCPNHNAQFNLDGSVALQPDDGDHTHSLKTYAVTRAGQVLRVRG